MRSRTNPVDVKMTEGGRDITGGGGIAPKQPLEQFQVDILPQRIVQLHEVILWDSPGHFAQKFGCRTTNWCLK